MRHLARFLFAGVALAATLAAAGAQDAPAGFSPNPVFTFAAAPGPEVEKDRAKLNATEDITVRPNQAAEAYLYAYNPTGEDGTFLVDVSGGPGSRLAARVKVNIPNKAWVRVRLPKAPPPPPPVAVPGTVPAAGAPAAAPPEPVPPGDELVRAKGFGFTVRLLDENGKAVTDAREKKPYGRRVTVKVARPDEYIAPPKGNVNRQDPLTTVDVTVSPRVVNGKPAFAGTAAVTLGFTAADGLRDAVVREGFYRRSLVVEGDAVPTASLAGTVEKARPGLVAAVGVDGFERAFTYRPDLSRAAYRDALTRDTTPAVRLFPTKRVVGTAATSPGVPFPIRIETDNDDATDGLEIWVRPETDLTDAAREVVKLAGPREERVWADVAGPTDGGVLVTARLRDWVKPLDLSAVRGRCRVTAVLTDGGGKGAAVRAESLPVVVSVDDTPPNFGKFEPLKPRLVKGQPLVVAATAADPESGVARAVFFVGKPLDDGALPPDAVKIDGEPAADAPGVWTAKLPIAADKRGPVVVGVQFQNGAGLATTKTQRIELVDPPPPTGTIRGVVQLGDRAQPKLLVVLRDADGKPKGTATTDDYGRFVFEKVILGQYTVASARKDSSYGSAGSTPVEVKADDPDAKPDPKNPPKPVVISLTRMVR